MIIRLALAALLAGTAAAGHAQEPAPTVAIDSGVLRGAIADSVASFKGIPFAAAPTGALRWRAPQPVTKWEGARDATQFGNICPQNPIPGDDSLAGRPIGEDCLFLNVWTPVTSLSQSPPALPVLVSIHGGGMVNGSGSDAVFDGAALARRGIVVVTFNYRLGRLGFFRHPALVAEAAAAGEPSGNYAFMDQIAALEWVKRNIGRFGGDPARVTIAGESAGGVSVLAMMTSPRAKGLFSAAIAQSAVPRFEFVAAADAASAGNAFAASAGLAGADTGALRAIPVATLLKGVELFGQDRKTYTGPMIDGSVIAESLMPAFAAGRQAPVPLIVGATARELGRLPAFAIAAMVGQLPPAEQAVYRSAYAPDGSADATESGIAYVSDRAFVEPARAIARLAAAGQPTWTYRFGYVAEHLRPTMPGASHASDVAYSFGTLGAVDPKASVADRRAADMVADYWANFVRTHDPNGGALPQWPRAGADGGPFLFIDNDRTIAGPDPLKARLDAIEGIAAK